MKKFLLPLVIIALLALSITIVLVYFDSESNEQEDSNQSVQILTDGSGEKIQTSYAIVDTGQNKCFDESQELDCGEATGQDANYEHNAFSYKDNKDGTVFDNITGLTWQQSADINDDGKIDINDKMAQEVAQSYCEDLELAGYDDWRLPDIKTIYSLMNFKGVDVSGEVTEYYPYITTAVFDFGYGDTSAGERVIDSQWATTTLYKDTVMNDSQCMFGLNLADGRIKCYPVDKNFNVKCVRGNEKYGENNYQDNGDGTITDQATGLTWIQSDLEEAVEWQDGIDICENLSYAGKDDWRLPNAKELHSIVDYDRSPGSTNSPAINSLFETTSITNEMGEKDWPFFWTSTTHSNEVTRNGSFGVYISFGRALGYMNGRWMDVHGAGAQRSDPKVVLDIDDLPKDPQNGYQVIDGAISHGPQGDVVRMENFARCVRGYSSTYNGEETQPTDDSNDFDYGDSSSVSSSSQQGQEIQDQETPPQVAISACSGKEENSVCTFKAPDGGKSGVCKSVGGRVGLCAIIYL